MQDGPARVIHPNILAYLVLAIWPLVVWQLYRRLDRGRALIWTVLGAYMILPPLTVFDLPVVPDMDKDTLPILSAFVISVLMLRDRFPGLPQGILGKLLVILFIAAPFATVVTNADPIAFRFAPPIPGMRVYDSLATVSSQILMFLPMFMARRDLATREAMHEILKALVVAGLAYSLPMLLEARLSPQLNVWIYGYFQHDFGQMMRFGGFRPIVFMPHGLWVAFFALMCLLAAASFLRIGPAEARPKQLAVFLWLLFILYICKSFGPVAYALIALPLIFFMRLRFQLLVAAAIAAVVMTYPLLRGAGLVPVQDVLAFVEGLNADRAQSFGFRLMNEEILLARANERPWFGWGGYARNFLHDADTGRMITVADGAWVIRIGSYGWLGYVAAFGLLCLPLWRMAREGFSRPAAITREAAAVALILAMNLADLIPNATAVPFTWLLAGALMGHAELLRAERRAARLVPGMGQGAQLRPRTVI